MMSQKKACILFLYIDVVLAYNKKTERQKVILRLQGLFVWGQMNRRDREQEKSQTGQGERGEGKEE